MIPKVPKDYPNPYIHNTYTRPYATFICWLITPTGRRSKFWQSITIYAVGKCEGLSIEELYKIAKEKINLDSYKKELSRGYKTTDLFLKNKML